MIPALGVKGARIGVLGMGRSGLAAAKAIALGGGAPVCWDDSAAGRAAAEAAGHETADLTDPTVAKGLHRLLVSPGVPHLYPAPHTAIAVAARLGLALDNDVGLFLETVRRMGEREGQDAPKTIAITGSNGKSTTAALIHHLLQAAGRAAQLGGNIGRAVFDLEPLRRGEVIVLELSSYQTELAARLQPTVAALTNLSPDHLDRHGGLGGYFAAKRRLFIAGRPELCVIGVDEPEGRFLAQSLASEARPGEERRIRRVSVRDTLAEDPHALAMEGDTLIDRQGTEAAGPHRYALSGLARLPGRHNHQNIAISVAAVAHLGLTPAEIMAGLESFQGLSHRLAFVAERGGVVFVNDSKATNVEAAECALLAYPRVRWIAGGREKEPGELAKLRAHKDRIARVYLIGECAASFAEQLRDGPPLAMCDTVEAAVARAGAEAEPGDTVLFSPAAASFDQFADFEARGRAFEAAVRALLSAE
ncbi:MAG: UDP-N-acetylmuramoyl-L-alanine--D-glutamate ligase [Pseudomonadota bacterium]